MTANNKDYPIVVDNITKSFKIYLDKAQNLKDAILYMGRRKYENRQVIKGISFHVKKGEAVALIGHNGCGKSTTLKMLTRIMYPDTGTITMKGRVSSLIELGAGFHPDMSGRENIYINASIFGLTKSEIDGRVDDIIEFSELEDYIDNPVRTYSSGMYMRLAFAVAINVDADILLVDEILAVGDAAFQQKCYKRMQELKAEGVTIVIVTHDMGTVKSFCDYALWINDGVIKSEGKSSEVADQYLTYMNNKSIERSNEEKARREAREAEKKALEEKQKAEEAQQSEQKEQEPAEKIKTEEAEEKLTMDPTAPHYGNQKVVITKCELINSEGKEVAALQTDEPYSLSFHYVVNSPLDEVVFGMSISTIDKLGIFSTNTQLGGIKVDITGKKEGIIEFHSEPLHLSGRFVLSISVTEKNNTPCDCYNEYMKFDVMKLSAEPGIVYYKTKWTI